MPPTELRGRCAIGFAADSSEVTRIDLDALSQTTRFCNSSMRLLTGFI
jgi:hypothetical protein